MDQLVRNSQEVTVLDNLSTGKTSNFQQKLNERQIAFVEGDIRDYEIVRKCVENKDYVVHLAAITNIPYSMQNPALTFEVNRDGTLNILKACAHHRVDKVVFASSCAIFGQAQYLPVDENHPLVPLSPYAESKISAYRLCQTFQEKHGVQTVCFNLFNVYGSRQSDRGFGGVIGQFIDKIRRDEPPVIYGDGKQTRDFVFVEDVTTAICRTLELGISGQSFNLGSGKATTINQLLEEISLISSGNIPKPVYKPVRAGDIRHSQANIEKAHRHLQFQPRTTLHEGLRRIVNGKSGLDGTGESS